MRRLRGIWGVIPILCLGFMAWAWRASLGETEVARTRTLPAIVFVEAPSVAPGPLAQRFPQGSHLARFTPGMPPSSASNLTPDFFAAADPHISFDATRILFAAQKSRVSRWQIWEMKVDGSGRQQITHCPANCLRPAFLPRKQIVYTVVNGKGTKQTSAIYVSQRDGADAHPITFGPGNFQLERVLRSGRLLVSAEPSLVADGRHNDSRVFYIMRPDGTGLTLFRWNNRPNYVRTGAEELDDGTVLFLKRRDPAGRETGGQLAWIRPGSLHNSVISRPGSVYWSAHLLDGNRLVVAKKNSSSSAAPGKFGLYVYNLSTRSVGESIYSNPKYSSVDAVPVEARLVPLYYPSILHPDRDYGRVLCLNSYISAGAPDGHLTAHIARVRVIALQPDHHSQKVLGEAPVESDGSFYIKVPADHPIRFELLGTKGSVIRAQKSWVWARNGEDMACLGCHENKAIVPTNHFPLAVKSFNAPTPVGVPSHSQTEKH